MSTCVLYMPYCFKMDCKKTYRLILWNTDGDRNNSIETGLGLGICVRNLECHITDIN